MGDVVLFRKAESRDRLSSRRLCTCGYQARNVITTEAMFATFAACSKDLIAPARKKKA